MKTVLSVLALAMGLTLSGHVHAASSTITIQQLSPSLEYGEWILTYPDGTEHRSTQKTKVLNSLETGTYRLAVRSPARSVTNIVLYRGSIVIQENPATIMTFELKDGEALRTTIEYAYTGTVKVQSNPAGIPFIMKDMNGGVYTGTTPAAFTDMSPVKYRVDYDVTRDCEIRKSQERILIEGSTLNFYADFNCGARPISTSGKTTEPTATGKMPPPPSDPESHEDFPAARIMQTSNLSEVVPGGNLRFTISIRNLTRGTLHNIDISDRFNPSSLEILSIMNDGVIDGENIRWTIPELYAGKTWTTTIEARAKDHLVAGDRIVLMAHAVSEEADADMYPEAWSSVVGVGIAYMPQTGFRYDLLIALAALMGAALTTISTNRVKQSVA